MAASARNSIAVAVRIRPPTAKEAALLSTSTVHGHPGFSGEGSLSVQARPQLHASTSYSSSSSSRRIIRAVDDRVLVFDPADANPLVATSRQVLGPRQASYSAFKLMLHMLIPSPRSLTASRRSRTRASASTGSLMNPPQTNTSLTRVQESSSQASLMGTMLLYSRMV